MNDWRNYDELSREELITRLRHAEDVCVYVGWTGSVHDSDRALATLELWRQWARQPGVDTSVDANADLADAEADLADARRLSRQAAVDGCTPQ